MRTLALRLVCGAVLPGPLCRCTRSASLCRDLLWQKSIAEAMDIRPDHANLLPEDGTIRTAAPEELAVVPPAAC